MRSLASVVAALLACCVQEVPSDPSRVTVFDSAGVRIVEYGTPVPAEAQWSLDAEPVFRIGQVEGAPEHQLFGVGPLARLSDGSVVVALTTELRFFSEAGAWIRTVGRRGGGPGEYREIESLYGIRGDSLVVWDRGARRVTWLSPDGAFVRSAQVSREPGALVGVAAVTRDGLLVTSRRVRTLDRSTDYRRDSLSITIHAGPSADEDLPLVQLGDQEWNVQVEGNSNAILLLPFSRRALAAATEDRIYLAETDRAEIRAYAPDGSLREISRLDRGPQLITPPLLDTLADYWHEMAMAEAAERGYALPERPAREYRESTRRLSRVPTMPALEALLTDGEGHLWVRGYDPPWQAKVAPSHWWVLGPDGMVQARIAFPPGLDVRCVRGDMVLGVVIDEWGVERVEVYRLRR